MNRKGLYLLFDILSFKLQVLSRTLVVLAGKGNGILNKLGGKCRKLKANASTQPPFN